MFHGRDAISQTSALGQLPPFDRTATLTGVAISSLAPFNPSLPQPPNTLQTLEPVPYADLLGVYQYENSGGSAAVNPDIVRPYLGYSHIFVNSREAVTRYNSLQTSLERRLARGLQLQLSYTFSHLISDGPNQDTEGRGRPVQDAYNVPAEKAFGTQDQPQTLSINTVWEMPLFTHTGNRLLRNGLGGWQLNGIYSLRSRLPQTICLDHDVVGLASGTSICERVDVLSNPNLSRGGQRTVTNFFDINAFQLQAPGTFGNSGRNNVRGPGINNFDLSLFKDFVLPHIKGIGGAESPRLQFRTEFFNAFNHTQFASINTTFVPAQDVLGSGVSSSSPFGSVSGARAPREIQFALKLLF